MFGLVKRATVERKRKEGRSKAKAQSDRKAERLTKEVARKRQRRRDYGWDGAHPLPRRLRPRGPSVVTTALASLETPRSTASRASLSNVSGWFGPAYWL